jgi:hypothetical protein
MSTPGMCTRTTSWLHQADPAGQTSGNKGFYGDSRSAAEMPLRMHIWAKLPRFVPAFL